MLATLLAGCNGCHHPTTDTSCPTGTCDSPVYGRRANATLYGSLPDEGYGAALAWRAGAIWVGAPFDPGGGRLYKEEALIRTGVPFLGTALVADDDTVLVGGDGRVEDDAGTVLATGTGIGGVLAASGTRWVTRGPTGAVWDNGSVNSYSARPDSIAILPEADGTMTLGVGFAFGTVALVADGLTISRDTLDEAGWAVLPFDADGDGIADWIVGAPGGNRVDIRDGTSLALRASWSPGTGRFGASLATDGTFVYVGAPMAGTDAQGAVWRCDPRVDPTTACTLLESGHNLQDQLGFSLAWGGENLYIGAPGGPGTAGSVVVR